MAYRGRHFVKYITAFQTFTAQPTNPPTAGAGNIAANPMISFVDGSGSWREPAQTVEACLIVVSGTVPTSVDVRCATSSKGADEQASDSAADAWGCNGFQSLSPYSLDDANGNKKRFAVSGADLIAFYCTVNGGDGSTVLALRLTAIKHVGADVL